MYTEIIKEFGYVSSVKLCDFGKRISIRCSADFLSDIIIGASVAVNGTCLTVVDSSGLGTGGIDSDEKPYFIIGATQATLDITNINSLTLNSLVHIALVNIKRSSKIIDELNIENIEINQTTKSIVDVINNAIWYNYSNKWRKHECQSKRD